ncbi:MAG: hypothetical protein WCI36_05395 [bacterium]
MKHLKDHIYYSELYDKFTIEECQRWEKSKNPESLRDDDEAVAKIKKDFFENCLIKTSMYFLKGERYLEKEKTIQEWMERDSAMDGKLENATEPSNVRCIGCSSSKMKCISRDLMPYNSDKDEVLFMFQCEKCEKRRAYWENGKEWESKPNPCPKCRAELQSAHVKKDNTIETTYSCSECGYKDTEILDLSVKENEEKVDSEFEANRKKYCLSATDGLEYFAHKGKQDSLKKLVDGWDEQDKNKELYDVIDKIKKITIVELENLLTPVLNDSSYIKFQLLNPEIEKDVIIPFSVHDSKSDRTKMASEYDLKRLLKKTLEYTNWRLMSEGTSYRLGFLSGRLRGVEGEDEFKRLAENILKRQKKLQNKK